MMKSCKHIAEDGECLKLKGVKKRYLEKPYYCGVEHWKSCAFYEKKEAEP
jgi:hypothetical protein